MLRRHLVLTVLSLLLTAAAFGVVLYVEAPSDAASTCAEDQATAQAALDELARVEASPNWSAETDRRQRLVDNLQFIHTVALAVCDPNTSTTAPTPVAPTTAPPDTVAPAAAPAPPPPPPPPPAPVPTAASLSLLLANEPGSLHEGTLHGVPAGYDWASRATPVRLSPPSADSGYVNLWGQIYADGADAHPANTRVNVADCELWRLPSTGTTWVRMQGDAAVEGGAWTEDYSRAGGPFDIRTEADGSQSMVPVAGWNSHFWTRAPLAQAGSKDRAYVTACSTRLVLADPAGADDRGSARYLVGVGADWRKADYGCPVVGGITICNSIGVGRHIQVGNDWRRVVFSTLSAAEVAALPAPPPEIFVNPDGTTR